MNCKQNCSLLVKGLLFGGVFLVSLLIVTSFSKNQSPKTVISYNEAVQRLHSSDVREINIENNRLNFLDAENAEYTIAADETQKIELLNQGNALNISVTLNDNPPPIFYVFQILFWLFLISPPIIVILLFVIIRKMDAKK
jgi:ATP-dependent Zn protease